MHLNSTHLVRGDSRALLQKRGVWEAELQDPSTHDTAPLLAALQGSSTLRTLLSVYIPQLALTSQAIKAQFNEGAAALATLMVASARFYSTGIQRLVCHISAAVLRLQSCDAPQAAEPASRCMSTVTNRCSAASWREESVVL